MEPGQVDQSQAMIFSFSHNPHNTALSRTHGSYNDNNLVQFHRTPRVMPTQFNYNATLWPSEGGRKKQKSGYWIVWYVVSAIDVSDKLCETGLDIGAMILINSLFIYYDYVIQCRSESNVKMLLYDLEKNMIHRRSAQLLSNDTNSVMNAAGQEGQRRNM